MCSAISRRNNSRTVLRAIIRPCRTVKRSFVRHSNFSSRSRSIQLRDRDKEDFNSAESRGRAPGRGWQGKSSSRPRPSKWSVRRSDNPSLRLVRPQSPRPPHRPSEAFPHLQYPGPHRCVVLYIAVRLACTAILKIHRQTKTAHSRQAIFIRSPSWPVKNGLSSMARKPAFPLPRFMLTHARVDGITK